MKNLTQYLKKTMLFFTPLLVVAFGLNYLADEGLKRTNNPYNRQWSRLYEEKAEADILILGNSRAACHVNPMLLGRCLSARAYNLGIIDACQQSQYHAYAIYRKKNKKKPSLILLNVDWTIKRVSDKCYFSKPEFLPWQNAPDWESFLREADYTLFERYVPLLKYGKKMMPLKRGIGFHFGKDEGSNWVEYQEGYVRMKSMDFDNLIGYTPPVEKDVSYTVDFFRQCRQEGIQVVCFYSPLYEESKSRFKYYEETYPVVDSLLSAWDIPFLDYSSSSICKDSTYFRDCLHLNKRGAEWLTKRLAYDIDSLVTRREIINFRKTIREL